MLIILEQNLDVILTAREDQTAQRHDISQPLIGCLHRVFPLTTPGAFLEVGRKFVTGSQTPFTFCINT